MSVPHGEPGSSAASLDDTQRDQDVRAALHFSRARSGTTNDPQARQGANLSPPGREKGDRDGGGADAPARRTSPDGRRRVGESTAAQMEQDVRFFSPDGGLNSPDRDRDYGFGSSPGRSVPQSAGRAPTMNHQAAAARLYRHHRNLSDTSVDSSGGAFIDHRRQPHSLGPISGPTPRRSAHRSSLRGEVPSSGGPELERRTSDVDDEFALDDAPMPISSPRSLPGAGPTNQPSNLTMSRPRSPSSPHAGNMSASVATARPHVFSSDLRGSAVMDDDEGDIDAMLDHRPQEDREARHLSPSSQTGGMGRSGISRHYSRLSEHRREGDAASMLTGSRRPSQAEEDVCFPMLNEPGTATLHPMEALHHMDERGLPGMLHNFPFPFDFQALEEFADRERDALDGVPPTDTQDAEPTRGVTIAADAGREVRHRRWGSPRMVGAGSAVDRIGMLKQRRLSESAGPISGRQRKLALFEGSDVASVGGANGQAAPNGRAAPVTLDITGRPKTVSIGADDSKTPLLKKLQRGYSSASGGGAGAGARGVERPYRFSFYSNALPSTIHARSLAEIPGDGQTFEELFTGRKGQAGEGHWEGSTDPTGGSGANTRAQGTPNLRNVEISSNAPSRKPTMGAPPLKRDFTGPIKPKLMRSDEEAEENTWWLDVLCPTDQEMKVLSKVFGIHPLTTEDIQMEETREKIELFRNYYLVCFRSFDQDPYSPTYLEPLNMYVTVFREGTLSFHFRGTPHPQNVRRRIKQLKDYINVTSDWISYALIDDITDAFGPLIQSIEYEVDSIDELVLILKDAEQSDMLRRIGTCRKKVMGLLRLMGNKADVVKGLAKRCNENWSVAPKSDIGLYLSDIQDHLVTMTQNLNHYEKILSRSHSNYLAQISIEATEANNQINDVLSKLTALGSILVPMNLVTGLWGMNVHVPGQDVEDNLHWFTGIVCCLVAFGILGAWLTLRYFNSGLHRH